MRGGIRSRAGDDTSFYSDPEKWPFKGKDTLYRYEP